MCIRDRQTAAGITAHCPAIYACIRVSENAALPLFFPVLRLSLIHIFASDFLQLCGFDRDLFQFLCTVKCICTDLVYVFANDNPVSYTHLDVYKRQVHICAKWESVLSGANHGRSPQKIPILALNYNCLLYTSRCV